MQPEQKARLREFYNQLADQPLEPDHRFYEPFVGAIEAEGDPIADLATGLLGVKPPVSICFPANAAVGKAPIGLSVLQY